MYFLQNSLRKCNEFITKINNINFRKKIFNRGILIAHRKTDFVKISKNLVRYTSEINFAEPLK